MITVVKRAPFVVFLCIGFALGDLGCIGYWNSVGIHLKFNNASWLWLLHKLFGSFSQQPRSIGGCRELSAPS